MTRQPAAGFTLVEVLVALVLFALIGMAGFSMLDQVLRTERQTEGRLDRLAELQRAMYLISLDFGQAQADTLIATPADEGLLVALQRSAPDALAGSLSLTYLFQNGGLVRAVSQPGAGQAVQPLIRQVLAVEWRFYDPDGGWLDQWPPPGQLVVAGRPGRNPQAVDLTITLADGKRTLRRVALLPGGL